MSQSLFIAWRSGSQEQGHWGPVGRLDYKDLVYRFVYTQGARTLPGFQPFAGMTDLEQVYESNSLFPLFANRLLARSRPEYEAYLTWSGFDYRHPPEPLAILGVTEGRRMTDALELFACPLRSLDGRYECTFFLHGLRHQAAAALELVRAMQPGTVLSLSLEPSNPADANAVAVYTASTTDGLKLGYVPRFLARDVRGLLDTLRADQLTLSVRRCNPDAPLQQRLLCMLQAPWPEDFAPCSGVEYQPIVAIHSALAA